MLMTLLMILLMLTMLFLPDFDVSFARDATPVNDASGNALLGFPTMPKNKQEAYNVLRSYYNDRIAWITSVGDSPYSTMARVNSVTCIGDVVIYAALWNSQGKNLGSTINAGLELQCLHAQVNFAMARGGSRRFGKVWTAQPSGECSC